jgi:hypothetical protein
VTDRLGACSSHAGSGPRPSRSARARRASLVAELLAGIGDVALGMVRHGDDLQLTRNDEKGLARDLLHDGMEHSATSATGTGWERTPWHATQRAAWEALRGPTRMARQVTQGPPMKRSFLGRAGIAGAARIVIIGRGGG